MTEFKTVCQVGDIPAGSGAPFPIAGTIVAVFNQGGKFFAINDFCPHMGASLAEGHFEDGEVMCPWHAWRFCVADGKWADNPSIKTETYEVRVVGDAVQIRIEEEADEDAEDDEEE